LHQFNGSHNNAASTIVIITVTGKGDKRGQLPPTPQMPPTLSLWSWCLWIHRYGSDFFGPILSGMPCKVNWYNFVELWLNSAVKDKRAHRPQMQKTLKLKF